MRLLLVETSGVAGFAGQRRFYRKLGFRREARIRDYYQAGDDKVVFAKSLSGCLRSLPLTLTLSPGGERGRLGRGGSLADPRPVRPMPREPPAGVFGEKSKSLSLGPVSC